MATRIVDLTSDAYVLITDKTNFIVRPLEGMVTIRAQATLPAADDEGLMLDPSKALLRLFDGSLYGKAVGSEARVVVLESDA
ncbi:hypothetical protein [Methylophaga nitratireducenticrescens]|uniref:hypothetical protein n=1 Tax=Methylophaga nitratireducenticrescens TaxID=754476 RepID=UPI000CDCDB9F|nr:hypothetical protein [Methylophaga nitratireducenticrescens]AUZ85852.1 hypothetical protein CDW43_15325 [Methylophaga nitratireducenticrescens]